MVMDVTGGNSQVKCNMYEECAEGMTCNPETLECYFDFVRPASMVDRAIPSGKTIVMETPNAAIKQGNGVVADWSGKIEFIADRSALGITRRSAFCNNAEHCETYQGMNGCATAVEFTFAPYDSDYYDVSVINGVSTSAEMVPDGLHEYDMSGADGSKGYMCGAAAAFRQNDTRLAACNWDFDFKKLSPLMTQVDGGHKRVLRCTSDDDCAKPFVCGNAGKTRKNKETGYLQPTREIRMECGNKIGTWSAYQLCVWTGSLYKSPAPFEGVIDCPSMHSMFACANKAPWTTSCYSLTTKKGTPCCGCADWPKVLAPQKCPPSGHGCSSESPVWLEKALPFYKPLKEACPTAYTYAYDDETSTFTCKTKGTNQNNGGKGGEGVVNNTAGYKITLCPEQQYTTPPPVVPVTTPPPAGTANATAGPGSNMGIYIGIAVLLVVMLGAAFLYNKKQDQAREQGSSYEMRRRLSSD